MNAIRARTDWPLLSAATAILAFGLVMVYSASAVSAEVYFQRHAWDFALRQFIAALLGIALMLVLKRIDYRRLRQHWCALAPLAIVLILLIGVIFFDSRGHRWYRIPGLGQFQPSEFAKPVIALFLAWFVALRREVINSRYTIIPTAFIVGLLTLLIGIGDLGTAAIVLTPALAVFYVAGIDRRYFFFAVFLMGLVGAGFILQRPYRILRITSFLGLTEEKITHDAKYQRLAVWIASSGATRDTDHQPRQSRIAVGSGGLTGVGLGQSTQKLGFLPAAHTDFIFGVVGEETGLAGCALLLLCYLTIFWRGWRLFWLVEDPFGRYLALGCVSVFTAQALFNMSVVLDIAPTKGIPLPLVSYGGSAVIGSLITLGLLMSVSDRAAAH